MRINCRRSDLCTLVKGLVPLKIMSLRSFALALAPFCNTRIPSATNNKALLHFGRLNDMINSFRSHIKGLTIIEGLGTAGSNITLAPLNFDGLGGAVITEKLASTCKRTYVQTAELSTSFSPFSACNISL